MAKKKTVAQRIAKAPARKGKTSSEPVVTRIAKTKTAAKTKTRKPKVARATTEAPKFRELPLLSANAFKPSQTELIDGFIADARGLVAISGRVAVVKQRKRLLRYGGVVIPMTMVVVRTRPRTAADGVDSPPTEPSTADVASEQVFSVEHPMELEAPTSDPAAEESVGDEREELPAAPAARPRRARRRGARNSAEAPNVAPAPAQEVPVALADASPEHEAYEAAPETFDSDAPENEPMPDLRYEDDAEPPF